MKTDKAKQWSRPYERYTNSEALAIFRAIHRHMTLTRAEPALRDFIRQEMSGIAKCVPDSVYVPSGQSPGRGHNRISKQRGRASREEKLWAGELPKKLTGAI